MAAAMRVKAWEVSTRLRELHMRRPILLNVLRACVAEYGGCTDNDPPSARGWEVYRWGTRSFREESLSTGLGWAKDDTANLSSIRNDGLGIAIVMLNTNQVTGSLDPEAVPQNRLKKGVLHERAVDGGTPWLPHFA
jgi:hypothetical protein